MNDTVAEREITVTVSTITYLILQDVAKRGVHGIGIEGVVEGFIYRGLQDLYRTTGGDGDE